MDVHVKRAITEGLRRREIDVPTAQHDGADRLPDSALLTRATELDRVLFSQDADLLAEAHHRQQALEPFSGLVFAEQQKLGIGHIIEDLWLIAAVYELHEMRNRVIHLPLRS
jgi:hypothetical protein